MLQHQPSPSPRQGDKRHQQHHHRSPGFLHSLATDPSVYLPNNFHRSLTVNDLELVRESFESAPRHPQVSHLDFGDEINNQDQESLNGNSSILSSGTASNRDDTGSGLAVLPDDALANERRRPESEEARPPQSMTLEEWVDTLCAVFAQRITSGATSQQALIHDAVCMFRQMTSKDIIGSKRNNNSIDSSTSSASTTTSSSNISSRYIRWGDVVDQQMAHMPPSTLRGGTRYLNHSGKANGGDKGTFRAVQHARRETVQKLLLVSGGGGGGSLVFILVSKMGKVGIYDDKLRLQRRYDVDMDTDPDSDLDVAASDPGWITDAIWMDNSKHCVYASSLRTMHFFDASASVHHEEYRAFGFKHIPTCLDYHFSSQDPEAESMLAFGDDAGGVTMVTFKQPVNSLFSKDEVDIVQCLFWPDMSKHADYASISYSPSVHKDGVLGLRLLSHNNTVVTVSRDPAASVCIRHVRGKFDSYVFKLGWGVRCFDFGEVGQLQVLATGSNDKVVRLWHPVVTARPASVMRGHKAGINDVKIHAAKRIIFSYDKECVIKVWSLDEGHCHQTVPLQFPSLNILGKEIEFGRPALYQVDDLATSQTHLVTTCCQHLTLIALREEREEDTDDESEDGENDNEDLKDRQVIKESEEGSRRQSPQKPATIESALVRDPHPESPSLLMSPTSLANSNLTMMPMPPVPASNRHKSHQPPPPLSNMTPTSSTVSSGWSIIRNAIDFRTRGRAFRQKEAEEDAEYDSFRIFNEMGGKLDDKNSLNVLKVTKYSSSSKMEDLAKDNMPFMGLEIHGLEEYTLPSDLPHTSGMRQRGLKFEKLEDLLSARLSDRGGSKQQHQQQHQAVSQAGRTETPLSTQEGGSSATGSRRSSLKRGDAVGVLRGGSSLTVATTTISATRKLGAGIVGGNGNGSNPKGLPIITEKSDTQSVASINETERDVDETKDNDKVDKEQLVQE